MKLTQEKWYRWAEMMGIFILIPTLFVIYPMPQWILYVALWGMAIVATVVLWRTPTFSKRRFYHPQILHRRSMTDVLVFFIPSAFILMFYTFYFEPDKWFGLIQEKPEIWARVMVLYPILSVYPQELIYRGFFFRRYAGLFSHGSGLIMASAIAFSYLHILFLNSTAVVLTFLGGIFFSINYYKHRSLLLASIDHSLYGCFIFTVGLGIYFYTGAIPR